MKSVVEAVAFQVPCLSKITTLLFSLLLSACSNGENGGPDIPETRNAQLTIHLASSQNARPVTKAKQEEKEDDRYEQKIETCWAFLVSGMSGPPFSPLEQADRRSENNSVVATVVAVMIRSYFIALSFVVLQFTMV